MYNRVIFPVLGTITTIDSVNSQMDIRLNTEFLALVDVTEDAEWIPARVGGDNDYVIEKGLRNLGSFPNHCLPKEINWTKAGYSHIEIQLRLTFGTSLLLFVLISVPINSISLK